MATENSTARLEARIPLDLQTLIQQAADTEGLTVTAYLIPILRSAALETLERSKVIRLTLADQEAFAVALLNPKPFAPALQRALERHNALLGG
jgi:uncharacterized protein (DUF1778 family)